MEKISINGIHKKCEDEFSKAFIDTYFHSEEVSRQYFKQHLNSNRIFLMFEKDKLVGFFNYIYQYSHYANYLADICVSKSAQGKGYSKYLLTKYIEISKEQKKEKQNCFELNSLRQ